MANKPLELNFFIVLIVLIVNSVISKLERLVKI